jgi:hypothetical protein
LAGSNSYSSFFEILDVVKTEFQVKDAYVEEGVPTFIIATSPHFKEKFENVRSKLNSRGFKIVIKRIDSEISLLVSAVEPPRSPTRRLFGISYPQLLFVLTVFTVAISGYLTVSSYLDLLRVLGRISLEDEFSFLWGQTVLYTISIMCIVGLHELGHMIANRIHRVNVSPPIFIPGIPGVTPGTFGAFMIQRDPVLNRDQLFDFGFLAPVVGFITSLVVSFFGYSLSLPVSRIEYELVTSALGPSQSMGLPLFFNFLGPYLLQPSPQVYTFFLHPLALAGWMGTLLTFLNAFPIGQFDGGHVARAIFGPKWHRTLSYVSAIGMFLAGWWSMALLAILFIRFEHPGTLDDATPLSRNRKFLAILFVIIFFSCFTLSPGSPIMFLLRLIGL